MSATTLATIIGGVLCLALLLYIIGVGVMYVRSAGVYNRIGLALAWPYVIYQLFKGD